MFLLRVSVSLGNPLVSSYHLLHLSFFLTLHEDFYPSGLHLCRTRNTTIYLVYAPIAPGQTSGQQPDISWACSVVWARPTLDWPLVFFSIEQEFSGPRCSNFFDYFVRNVNYVLLCRQEPSWRDERHSKIAIADLGGHNLHLVSQVSNLVSYVNWLLIIYPASKEISARRVLIIIQSSVSGLSLLIKENRAASRVFSWHAWTDGIRCISTASCSHKMIIMQTTQSSVHLLLLLFMQNDYTGTLTVKLNPNFHSIINVFNYCSVTVQILCSIENARYKLNLEVMINFMTNLHATISPRKDCQVVSSNGLKCTYSVISHLPCTVYYSILILNFIEKLVSYSYSVHLIG